MGGAPKRLAVGSLPAVARCAAVRSDMASANKSPVKVDCCYGISVFRSSAAALLASEAVPPVTCIGMRSQRNALERNKKEASAKETAASASTTVTIGASYTTARMRQQGQPPLCSFGFQVNAVSHEKTSQDQSVKGKEPAGDGQSDATTKAISRPYVLYGNAKRFWVSYANSTACMLKPSFARNMLHSSKRQCHYIASNTRKAGLYAWTWLKG